MKKSTLFFLCSTMLLLGTILGFLLSPVRKGFSIGSNNGNSYGDGSTGKENEKYDDGGYGEEDDIPF